MSRIITPQSAPQLSSRSRSTAVPRRAGEAGHGERQSLHTHIGHVMTTWKEMPTGRASSGRRGRRENRTGACGLHAEVAGQSRLHEAACGTRAECARSDIEPKGPGSARSEAAAAGAWNHVQLRGEVRRRIERRADTRRARARVTRERGGTGRTRRSRRRRKFEPRHRRPKRHRSWPSLSPRSTPSATASTRTKTAPSAGRPEKVASRRRSST